MLRTLIVCTALFPLSAAAADLLCVPDTMCIDADCQKGHDDKAALLLRDWQNAKPLLHTHEGDVHMVRGDKKGLLQWAGRNAEHQVETLSVRQSNMHFTYVITLEPGSAANELTARGVCAVKG